MRVGFEAGAAGFALSAILAPGHRRHSLSIEIVFEVPNCPQILLLGGLQLI